ncbi:hypothetical protein [Hippea alviniae]|uniref:hypothetical protein n=1 Tax=Hippea alviniae TaxID=1279027 RepID=UPI0004075CBC|nr:hypothetical protein [Hippea alviniae]
MTLIYTYSNDKDKFTEILDKAEKEGEVLIKRDNGKLFILKPIKEKTSPLKMLKALI